MAREHIRAFRDVPGVVVSGILSRTRARAEALAAEFDVRAVCDSISELYARTRAEILVVAVPELSMSEICCASCEFPWTLLVEKPAGYNLEDAIHIEAAVRAQDRRAFVALNRRHYSSTLAVREDLARRPGPRMITVQDQEDPARALAAGQPKLVVDNWMYANAIHLIDYLLHLGRGPASAVKRIVPWNPEQPRYVVAAIEFESGDIGLYEAVWRGPGPWAVSVATQEIRWEMRPLEHAAYQSAGDRTLHALEQHPWDATFKPGLRRQAEQAVGAARGQAAELPTLADALDTMRLVRAIYEA